MRHARWLGLCIAVFLCAVGGCTTTVDTRDQLLASARASDPDFPDGAEVKLIRFAYIGRVESPEGPVYVCEQRAVICGMQAPRGLGAVQYFDREHNWLGKDSNPHVAFSPPLWTTGAHVFLFGGWPCEPKDSDEVILGNAIDFSRGFKERRVVQIPAYGSSSGDSSYIELTGARDVANPESHR